MNIVSTPTHRTIERHFDKRLLDTIIPAFEQRFRGITIAISIDSQTRMRRISRVDTLNFTTEQEAWVNAYCAGVVAGLGFVKELYPERSMQ